MYDIPVYRNSVNVPQEIESLPLTQAEAVDSRDPAHRAHGAGGTDVRFAFNMGWFFRYETRNSARDGVGASVYVYDRDETVQGGSRTERAKAEFERSTESFERLGSTGSYDQWKLLRSGYATSLAPPSSSWFQRLLGRSGSAEETAGPSVDGDASEDVGWWWGEFRYRKNGEWLVTHLTLRVDAGFFQKVLFTYPASRKTGHNEMEGFVQGWRRKLSDFLNAETKRTNALEEELRTSVDAQLRDQVPDLVEALDQFSAQIQENPGDVKAWKAKGVTYQAMGFSEQALACYDRALAADPQEADVLTYMGQLLMGKGQAVEANELFVQAIQLNSKHVEAWIGAGTVYFMRGMAEKALGCYDHALEENEGSGKAWFMKSLALGELGRAEESQRCRDRSEALGFEAPE